MSADPAPPPPAFALFHRAKPADPWKPIRKTDSYSAAVDWLGVERPGGDWVILPWGQGTAARLPKVKGESCTHLSAIPADIRTWATSPAPTPEERAHLWAVARKPPPAPPKKKPAPKPPPEPVPTEEFAGVF